MQFTKVHGLGNDFVLVDGRTGEQPDFNAIAPRICHRQTGVGADGILVVLNSSTADVRMRIINSDGSEAEMCGNGIRAFSKYVFEKGIVAKPVFTVETLAGVMRPALVTDGNQVTGVRVDMGEPFLACDEIPVVGEGRCINREMTLPGGETVRYTTVLIGVPHTTVYVDDPTDRHWMEIGSDIEHASVFPRRSNVNFAHVTDRANVTVRTWERGCGPTLACGTGCCGVAVASVLNGLTDRSVDVHIALGALHIDWDGDNHVYMTGPAEIVFTGDIPV